MKLQEFLDDRRLQKLIEEYWKIEFSFNEKPFEQSYYYETVGIGKLFEEWYLEGMPFNYYYKRFGNLAKKICNKDKEKEVTKIRVGCSGRKFECVLYMNVEEHNSLDKIFKLLDIKN